MSPVFIFLFGLALVQSTYSQVLGLGNGICNNGFGPNMGLNGFGPGNLAPGLLGPNNLGPNLPGLPGPIGYGDVAVAGELPVGGSTAVAGQVPVIGYVTFEGLIPAGGLVSVAGNGCGCNGVY